MPSSAGDGVHHLLAADGLHHPRAAVGAAPARVRVDGLGREPDPGDPVRAGVEDPDEADGAAAGGREGADVLDELGPGTEDVPVGVEGEAQRHAVVAGVLARHQVLATVLDPLDRPTEALAGEHDRELLGDHEHLLAEAAADVAHHDAHPVLREPEGARDRKPRTPWAPWVEVCTTSSLRKPSQIDTTPRHSIGTQR